MDWEGSSADCGAPSLEVDRECLEVDQGSNSYELEMDSTSTKTIPRKEDAPAAELLLVCPPFGVHA